MVTCTNWDNLCRKLNHVFVCVYLAVTRKLAATLYIMTPRLIPRVTCIFYLNHRWVNECSKAIRHCKKCNPQFEGPSIKPDHWPRRWHIWASRLCLRVGCLFTHANYVGSKVDKKNFKLVLRKNQIQNSNQIFNAQNVGNWSNSTNTCIYKIKFVFEFFEHWLAKIWQIICIWSTAFNEQVFLAI